MKDNSSVNPRCAYCGAGMEYFVRSTADQEAYAGYYRCPVCLSRSPLTVENSQLLTSGTATVRANIRFKGE